jgi:TatD DNase family protein
MLIDTHAHLYLDAFQSDRDAMLQRARDAGVAHIVLPAIDVASIHRALDLCARHDGVFAMAALHPSETKEATEADLEAVGALCDHERVVAVGETGLDYYWDRSFDDRQQAFLRRHVRLAIEKDLPLILHTRDRRDGAEVCADVLAILRAERAASPHPERLRGIFHCYSGTPGVPAEAAALGFLLGIGGTVTFKNSGVAEALREVPMAQIVLETDAPFLAPVPFRGKRNESAYVRYVAEKVAEVKGLAVDEVARITSANARALFRLP